MSILKEFKEFAMRGNLVEMAIGIVIGAAFGTVTKAFIEGIFMPLLGLVFRTGDLSKYSILLGHTQDGKPNLLMIGNFAASVLNFLIVAFVMFLLIKGMNRFFRKQDIAPETPAGPSQEQLLTEIRDILKTKP